MSEECFDFIQVKTLILCKISLFVKNFKNKILKEIKTKFFLDSHPLHIQ